MCYPGSCWEGKHETSVRNSQNVAVNQSLGCTGPNHSPLPIKLAFSNKTDIRGLSTPQRVHQYRMWNPMFSVLQ